MFYHVKDLQFNARVSKPDPAFATLLLEQFGGANGELAAAMRYFVQAFGARNPYPDKYDLLMDIATEEFSHLEIVGATIQMLLTGINGDLKEAAEKSEIMQLLNGKTAKESFIHQAMVAPQFMVGSAGGPAITNCQGVPWTAAYINGDATGELTADLQSDIAAESRAKMVYEYLLQFTDDPYVKETLRFLMTREVAHFQMFEAALQTIKPNFRREHFKVTRVTVTCILICRAAPPSGDPGTREKARNSAKPGSLLKIPFSMCWIQTAYSTKRQKEQHAPKRRYRK